MDCGAIHAAKKPEGSMPSIMLPSGSAGFYEMEGEDKTQKHKLSDTTCAPVRQQPTRMQAAAVRCFSCSG